MVNVIVKSIFGVIGIQTQGRRWYIHCVIAAPWFFILSSMQSIKYTPKFTKAVLLTNEIHI